MRSKGAQYKNARNFLNGTPFPLSNTRISIVLIGICLFSGILVFRLVKLTASNGDRLRKIAYRQMQSSMNLRAERGLIRDRTGRNLATNLTTKSIYVIANQMEDPMGLARGLARLLNDDVSRIQNLISKADGFVWISRQRNPDIDFSELRKKYPENLGVVEESKRFYPEGGFAPQIMGFTGIDNQGLWGIEISFENILKGTPGRIELLRDARRKIIPESATIVKQKRDGQTLVLTLDPVLQHIAQRELDVMVKFHKAQGGMVTIINPKTGEILAMASNPNFDANNYSEFPRETYRNRAISQIIEPGSTMKPLIAALAIREGFDPFQAKYNCAGAYPIGRRYIHDVNNRSYGVLSIEGIIIKSSNIGVAQISLQLGQEKVAKYFKSLGFDRPVGLGLIGEEKGMFPSEKEWPQITLANVAFGQGIALTPLQLMQAYTVFANDGFMVKPYLIQRIESADGRRIYNVHNDERIKILEPEQASIMRQILQEVVEKGTGKMAQVNEYSVGGKTGTSQKALKNGRGFDPNRFVSSFIGFIPIRDPGLLIMVMIDEPEGRGFGGQVAAPVFSAVAREAVIHLGIRPDNETISQGAVHE